MKPDPITLARVAHHQIVMLICEHDDCEETQNVRDYVRTKADLANDPDGPFDDDEYSFWLSEPIALCQRHAGDHVLHNEKTVPTEGGENKL